MCTYAPCSHLGAVESEKSFRHLVTGVTCLCMHAYVLGIEPLEEQSAPGLVYCPVQRIVLLELWGSSRVD